RHEVAEGDPPQPRRVGDPWQQRLACPQHPFVVAEEPKDGSILRTTDLPAACRADRDDRQGAATTRELQRGPTAERVADEVGTGDSPRVELTLEHVEARRNREALAGTELLAAVMAGEGGREHRMTGFQSRDDRLPGLPGVGEAVEQNHRGTSAPRVERL